MAGVTAHNTAIVSSANTRVFVTLMSVLLSLTTINKDTAADYDASLPLTATAVTVITALNSGIGQSLVSS
jgi:hypothetical protein